MPELKCTVQTCAHNQNCYCNLDKIEVGGTKAKHAEETCCDSFQPKSGTEKNSYSNACHSSVKEAEPCSCVDCRATECKYNDNCTCIAGKISVEGGDACQCSQTECATFRCC